MSAPPHTPPFLPYGRQSVNEDDVAAVIDVLRSDWLTTGPAVDRFEADLAARAGTAHACVLNSGTSALHAAYFAAGLGPGDVLVTSPLTFVATANAAHYLGADVRLVDVCPDTGNLDPDLLRDALDDRVRIVAPVDFAGHPADYPALRQVLGSHPALVVADAAHSFGATLNGVPVGQLADLTEISMHPVKPLTSAEGGAVLTNHEDLDRRVRTFRSHGIVRDPETMTRIDGPWSYEMQTLGYNYRLTDLQCALGLSQLRRLDAFIARRQALAARYTEALADLDALILPTEREGARSGWHLYVVLVAGDAQRRRPFFERLRALGLGVQVHYLPVHLHPYWQEHGFREGQFPAAEEFYARSVSLPLYPAMSDEDVESSIARVRQAVREVLA
ncbi:MAG: UDP-4-amino-4,6-dideoxy-N-acetyl-beta-L-altrosamine transaminase [Deltaproteobacteria bacterium]|nr:MAG: UDP-4-amino-4,6-dideoxy-N-acetyl-beta-L-altrosamine transaminase [Deltaproteobacteria bacterium]